MFDTSFTCLYGSTSYTALPSFQSIFNSWRGSAGAGPFIYSTHLLRWSLALLSNFRNPSLIHAWRIYLDRASCSSLSFFISMNPTVAVSWQKPVPIHVVGTCYSSFFRPIFRLFPFLGVVCNSAFPTRFELIHTQLMFCPVVLPRVGGYVYFGLMVHWKLFRWRLVYHRLMVFHCLRMGTVERIEIT